ncbi:CoA transferase [Mesorhizobium sp. CGMCC 1.15528]|uniref:CoA transferase n=1 Tax=Mesorhizobium zhangyense TaxID=1776730 RepID=A0A7C9VH24_9HYPH|nr:CaiB/BaiF CoA-transferase family protein [Mesorhizobium zhangyense]NGN44852.1 CoA transferase [Mesorhizobium zhangyense]
MTAKPGPLSGLTVVEMAGLGPVPLAGLILSEMGADVIRVERLRTDRAFLSLPPEYDLDRHGREILRVDLKQAQGVELVLRLVEKADALIEGFRPGVMEKLGLGPKIACARNPGLIYGRMTGFGQTGPMAQRAGHDLTYLAYTGILHAIGQKGGKPVPPLNLVADYGGGTMFLITGILAALFERFKSGKGQVVDAAMVDGTSMLATPLFGFMAAGFWQDRRGENLLDSGAPFYDTYETADGRHIAVACLEPQFFAEFCRLLPLDQRFAKAQYDKSLWDEMRGAITDRLRMKSRDEWSALFEDTDACVAPVLSLKEAPHHPHNRARQAHVEAGSLLRPGPAPRFSRSGTQAAMPVDSTPATILSRFGISETEIETLAKEGIVGK